jgi:Methyltransferase domain
LSDPLSIYLKRGQKVPGWLDPYSGTVIADLSRHQYDSGITGSLGEIGVHMGRLFILLKLTAMPNEKCFAIDVFDDQHQNTDRSGGGNLATFLKYVLQWTGDTNLTVIQSSSLDVEPNQIISAVGHCRLLSVDGGHTEQCAYNDLQLADATLIEPGVVVLDDFFNEMWPGVATGSAKYFLNPATKLHPFAITPNKLYLSSVQYHKFYRDHLQNTQRARFNKTVQMFGYDVDVYGCGEKYSNWRGLMQRAIRSTPMGPYALRVKQALKT